jgi:hypothetical protein
MANMYVLCCYVRWIFLTAVGLISYSEATRYTPAKSEQAKIWCKENNKPMPKHLLYPRVKGFVTTVNHLRKAKHVKAVYDIAIAYSHNNKSPEYNVKIQLQV